MPRRPAVLGMMKIQDCAEMLPLLHDAHPLVRIGTRHHLERLTTGRAIFLVPVNYAPFFGASGSGFQSQDPAHGIDHAVEDFIAEPHGESDSPFTRSLCRKGGSGRVVAFG